MDKIFKKFLSMFLGAIMLIVQLPVLVYAEDEVILPDNATNNTEITSSTTDSESDNADKQKNNSVDKHDYAYVLSNYDDEGAQGLVKQYIKFLEDPTYTPSIANSATHVPDFTNAITFVNADFNIKPSLFPAMRDINTSVLNSSRTYLWIGTDDGVSRIRLSNNDEDNYTKESSHLLDNKVILLIDDGHTGIYAITETGVSHIKK